MPFVKLFSRCRRKDPEQLSGIDTVTAVYIFCALSVPFFTYFQIVLLLLPDSFAA